VIRRSMLAGLLVGLTLVVVGLYPTFSLLVYPRILHVRWPDWPQALRLTLLVLDGLAALAVVGLVGGLAAWRSRAGDALQGLQAGAGSGLVAGFVLYALLVAPTLGLVAAARLWIYVPTPEAPFPPEPMVLRYIHDSTRGLYQPLLLCLVGGGLVGALEGIVVGLVRRPTAAAAPALLDIVDRVQPRRVWFADHDGVWRTGVLSGLVVGFLIWLRLTVSFFSDLKVEWPQLVDVVGQRTGFLTQILFSNELLNFLFPLLVLVVLGTGALAVLLLQDPPRRHLSRFQVVLVAGVMAAVGAFLPVAQMVNFWLGTSRFLAQGFLQQARPLNPQGEVLLGPQVQALLQRFAHSPELSMFLFYVLPLILFTLVLVAVLAWLAPQAVFYGLALPLAFRRPVDRAARIAHTLRGEPAAVLPQIYRLFGRDEQALKVLPHLTFQLKDRPAARLVAAYHTLGTNPGERSRAVGVIRQTIAGQGEWRWRGEVGELYRVLEEGLATRTLDQVTAIAPPPQEITSSLPVVLSRSCEAIGRILGELTKVGRVDDLSTKIIFLNSAQTALLDLHRYVEQESKTPTSSATLYPELDVIHALLDRWQGFVLMATQDLQGRADLQADLRAPQAAFGERVRQRIVVTNQGLNVAQNVRFHLQDGEGYRVIEGSAQQVDILGPGETRELEFCLAPEAPRRLRLVWQITFDDAVDVGRQVRFADAMDLQPVETDRPFRRIFPIPYVTGTPLRSGEMFVGRQDVFEFVREHLLGAYQNNVIVLHGQRRTGKTSILYRLQEVMAGTHVAVLVDMQGKAARGTADFLYALSDDIAYALESQGMAVALPARAEYERAPEFTFASRFLRSAVAAMDGRNLLLMFDEFEELQKRVEDGRLEPEIFPFLRNLMQHEPRLDFIFSGTHKLEELGAEYWSILFNIAAYKRITFLDPDEVRSLAIEPVAPFGLEFDRLAIQRIIQVTAGHPYFAQVVCHELVVFHNETERNYLTVTCVDEVLERIIERGEAHFKYIWAGATAAEQRVMLALAGLLPDADASANTAQIAGELQRKAFDLEQEDLERALARLQARDIVTRSGPQSGLYRFKIDLIRRWIGITRPVETH
jgi:hypothetical protein